MDHADVPHDLGAHMVAYVPLANGDGENVDGELVDLVQLAADERNLTPTQLRTRLRAILKRLADKLEGLEYCGT